jgi:predicted membrane channel-forming protein YqfA (hemolysin III family)
MSRSSVLRLAPLISIIEKIKTSSALAPLLALNVILGVVSLIATPMLRGDLLLWFIWVVFFGSVFFTLAVYLFWAKKSPNRLQTEHYQLAHQRLLMIGDERNPHSRTTIEGELTSNTVVSSSP